MNTLTMALLGLAIFAYFLYQQTISRPVSRRDLTLPAILALVVGYRYLNSPSIVLSDAVIVLGAAAIGLGTGFLAGQMIRVWRDEQTGIVYQHGGWHYLLFFIGLLIVRLVARVALQQSGIGVDASLLNDAFIAMVVGNFLGRAASVGLRALALHGWNYDALPRRRDLRRQRRARGVIGTAGIGEVR
jgi:hypothetical protein